jgi:glucose-6-phosphate dehydrogenase assembly protein OpcA
VAAERISPSADLLSAWLADRLRVKVERTVSDGPGITSVQLETKDGPISLERHDGKLATLSIPGEPERPVALKRRDLAELLAEELRHLDPDEVYASTVKKMVRLNSGPAARGKARRPRKAAS